MVDLSDLGALSPDDTKKLQNLIDAGKRQLQEVDDIRSSLRDTVKGLAEEFGLKATVVMKAVRMAYKNDLSSKREEMATVEDILQVTGNA